MRITPLKKPKEQWVTSAMTDDEMVVELLLRLKHAETVKSESNNILRWGLRQRRSRLTRLGIGFVKKETDSLSARASPMTPLCWSGGSEETSCSTSTGSGSKALHGGNEITSCRSKRSKRNKRFLDLKDAENLQMKERFDLQKKIANVQATYEERSFKNQGLKRIKLEYSDRVNTIRKANMVDESRKRTCLPSSISQKHTRVRNESKRSEEKGLFCVPDLNMTPTEEDETLYGTS